jgi:glyoxylase-like metal-dependent hydrolase (beta-lactamase superfamily II)
MEGNNMQKITLGATEILSFTDTIGDFPLKILFPDIQAEQWFAYQGASQAQALTGEETVPTRIGAFVVRSPESVILVDTGLGLGATMTPPVEASSRVRQLFAGLPVKLLDELEEAGIKRDDIDVVFLTHPHFDHYGWNLTAEGAPMFPHATYMLSQTDWNAYQQPSMPYPMRWGVQQFIEPLKQREKLNLLSGKQSLTRGISVLPTPGHSPGHISLLIEDGGQQLVMGGDTFVHPLQIASVEMSFIVDMDRTQATETRKQLREWIAREGIILASNHIEGSGMGHIVQDGREYRWQAI